MSDDYIKREDAIKALDTLWKCFAQPYMDVSQVMWCAKHTLEVDVPPADVVERKSGKWIVGSEKCTCCGGYGLISFNFCPNCGADMRGKDNE